MMNSFQRIRISKAFFSVVLYVSIFGICADNLLVLISLFYPYKYEVFYDKAFREELYDLIIDHRDKRSKIMEKLEFYTRLLAEQGPKVLPTEKAFEKVKSTSNIYELRLLRNPNLRILLTFCDTNKIVFLTIFYEKSTKKDYSRYIKIAEGRLKNNC